MDSVTPQGGEHIDSELFPIYQLIRDGKSEELAKMVKKNPFLIYQIIEIITKNILVAPDQPKERLAYCFYILERLVREYGIPVVLDFNNMEVTMKLHEVALKGVKNEVNAFLVACLEIFSFDVDKAIVTYLADLYIQLNPLAISFPTKELPQNAFLEFFQKVQKVVNACQEPLNGTEAEKKQLQAEVQNLLSNEDFENKAFNPLEKELALWNLNELISARDRLEPEPVRKASADEEEKINIVEEKSPIVQEKKVPEKEESKSPAVKKSKEEQGYLARFKTSFVLNEKVYDDEGKTTEYKDYRYPFEASADKDPRQILQKTICGFLNRRGGRIYLGIHDSKSVRGMQLTQKKRDELKNDIQSLIRDFEPDILSTETVSIQFVPVKQSANSKPIPGLFVVKIIVKQGDTSQLYSVQKRMMECYMRGDGRVDLLNARTTADTIRKRDRNPEKPVPEEDFEDPEPEQLIDEYDKKFMENMNNSKIRFDKALKHGPAAGLGGAAGAGNKGFYNNQNNQGGQQNYKPPQQNMGGGFGQQQNKPAVGGAFGQSNNNNFNHHQQNQNQQGFGGGGGWKNNNPLPQNQNQNQQGFGGGGAAKNNNIQPQHNQNQGKPKAGNQGPPDWKEKLGIPADQEIFEVAIDGLPLDITQKEFEELVCQDKSFKIINPRKIKTKNGLVKGFANFTSIEQADRFISLYNERKVGNSIIYVDFNFAVLH